MSLSIRKRLSTVFENEPKTNESNELFIDVTDKSNMTTFSKFSPMFPHMDIPVPGTNGICSASIEGALQGLKVFEKEGIDLNKMTITTMKNLKRNSSVKRGKFLGYKYGDKVIDHIAAFDLIYIPMYEYVLQNKLKNESTLIKGLVGEGNKVVLLDYETGETSNAQLIKRYLMS